MSIILASILEQKLGLWQHTQQTALVVYPFSSAKKGAGEIAGSEKTPRGRHCITQILGRHTPLHSVWVQRQWTGEVYTETVGRQYPQRDWILSCLLRCSGLEENRNLGGTVDSMARFIYIHGTPDDLKKPRSHGCLRMHIQDIRALANAIQPYYSTVHIIEGPLPRYPIEADFVTARPVVQQVLQHIPQFTNITHTPQSRLWYTIARAFCTQDVVGLLVWSVQRDTCHIAFLQVLPQHRQQGVGQQLLDQVVGKLYGLRLSTIQMKTTSHCSFLEKNLFLLEQIGDHFLYTKHLTHETHCDQ